MYYSQASSYLNKYTAMPGTSAYNAAAALSVDMVMFQHELQLE